MWEGPGRRFPSQTPGDERLRAAVIRLHKDMARFQEELEGRVGESGEATTRDD
jgi:hypothetical protein